MTHPGIPTERGFGLSVGLASAGFSAWAWWRGDESAAALLGAIALLLVGAALVAPAILRAPNRVWWRLAQVLGWINTRVLLTLFFVAVITPIGGIMRVGRWSRRRTAAIGWLLYTERRRDPTHYRHMF